MQYWSKMKFGVLAAFLAIIIAVGSVSAADLPGKGKTVTPGRATWTTGFFLEALYSRALEALGYDVDDPKDMSNPIFYQAVTLGDVDFWANGWFPIHYAQMPKNYEKDASLVGYIVKSGALQGYLASKDMVEKFNIKSLEDFKRPEVKKAFDANGDGKADLVGCPPGWGCEKTQTVHMKVYDLEEHVNIIKAGYSASMADAVARFNNGEPVLFYTWTPNWTVYKMKPGKDVMWINVPEIIPTENQKGSEEFMSAAGVAGAVSDPIDLGYVVSDIRVVANNEFLAANPAAKKLFELMSVPLADIAAQNTLMMEGEDSPKEIEAHVDKWIEKNRDKWDAWIAEAAKAN